MEGIIDPKATLEQIDSWFSSTPQDRIPRLVDTIGEWRKEDVSRLRLDKRLSQEEIVELLEAWVEVRGSREPVIHHLVINRTSTLISLLDRVTPQHLLSLFRLKDSLGLNALSWALWCNRLPIPRYLVKHLGIDGLYNLLCERDEWSGGNQLHGAVRLNDSHSEVLSLLKDETRVHQLLSIRDKRGRSVLSYSICWGSEESFQSIIRHYTGKQAELLELAAITDNYGNTSFHHAAGQETSNYLTDLIKATCSLKTRGRLANVLSKRNNSGSKSKLGVSVEECHPDNESIYDWASDSLTNNRYLLFDLPSVLIMYSTAVRAYADKEATSLEECFTDLGFRVKAKSSFTKKELFEAIKDHQGKEASRNGQIVALMSHGYEGYITDSEGVAIPLTEIEEKMCAATHSNTAKLLILQCCQHDDEPELQTGDSREKLEGASSSSSPQSDANPTGAKRALVYHYHSYSPRHSDFAALVSTGPGSKSERNQFIPKLAAAITSMGTETSISDVMKSVKLQFRIDKLGQAPFYLDGFTSQLCLKSVLPIYLKNKKTHKRRSDSEPLDSSIIEKRRR